MTKRVSFCDEVVVPAEQSSLVNSTDDCASSTPTTTMNAKQTSWYQSNDYRYFLRDRRQTAKALREVHGDESRLDASRYCLRGLESSLTNDDYDNHHQSHLSYSRERRLQQTAIIRMILEAQHEQRQLGIQTYHDNLRALSMLLSKVARDRAIEVAALDAAAVAEAPDDEHHCDNVKCFNGSAEEPLFQQQQQQQQQQPQSACRMKASFGRSVVHLTRQEPRDPAFDNSSKHRLPESVRLRPSRSKRRRSLDSQKDGPLFSVLI